MEVAGQRAPTRNYVFAGRRRTPIVPSCRQRAAYAIVIVKICVPASNADTNFFSDRVAGPFVTAPSMLNFDPWHGHENDIVPG